MLASPANLRNWKRRWQSGCDLVWMLCGSSLYACDKHRRTSDLRNARKAGGGGAIRSAAAAAAAAAAAQPSPAHTRPVTTCRRVCIRLPIVVKYLELKIRLDDATEEEQHGRVWQVWHVGRPDEQFPGRSSAR